MCRGAVRQGSGMRVVLGFHLAVALVSASGGCRRRGSEGECGGLNLGGVRLIRDGLDAVLGERLGDRLHLCGFRGLGDVINDGCGQSLGDQRVLDGCLRRGAEGRDFGGRGGRRYVSELLGLVGCGGSGGRGRRGDRRGGEHLVKRRQHFVVAGAFGRGSHRFLRLVGCVSRHYLSWCGGRRGGRCQDVHHSTGHVQAGEERAHHGGRFARGCEAQDQEVYEAGQRGHERELHAGQGHAAQRRRNLGVDAHEPQEAKAHEARDDRRGQVGRVGAQQACTVNVAVLARHPYDRDDALGQAAHGLAEGSRDDPPAGTCQGVHRPADDHLEDRGADAHEEDGLDVLVGEEDALAHEDHAGRGHAGHERGEDEGVAGHGLGIPALGRHRDLHHGDGTGHQHGCGDEGQRRNSAHAQVVVVGHRAVVAVSDGTGHAGEDRGRQRHRDERLGNHEDHERRRVGEDADDAALSAALADETVGHGSQVVRGQDTDLGHAQGRERPSGHARHRPERGPAEVEVRLEGHSSPTHWPQQAQGLADDAEGRGSGEDPELCARQVARGDAAVRRAAPNREESAEARDAHDVVDDGGPHVGPEDLARVEELAEQVVQAVEEELRQAQEGEKDREVANVLGVAGGCDHHQDGRQHHRREGDEEEKRSREGQQAVDVGVTVVAALDGADDLRDQDGVEDAGRQQVEDRVGQRVRGLEGGADTAGGRADGGDQHRVTDETEDA